jgi:hypothetical protein
MSPEGSSGPQSARRSLLGVTVAAGATSAIMIAHALYGVHRYENSALYHLVPVSLVWLVLAMVLAGVYVRRPGPVKRWLLVAFVGLPYAGIFGVLHGAIGHTLKLVFFAAGMSPDRLAQVFDLGDFVVPDDAIFETTGVATFVAGLFVAYALLRFVHATQPGQSGSAPSDTPLDTGSAATNQR